MRRGLVVLAAATVLLTGCHEYWGGGAGASDYSATATLTYDPTAADEKASSNVRAAIPAIEAWKADHGTYKGMTVAALNGGYDRTIGDSVRLVGPLTKDLYCIESSVVSATWHKAGPAALVESGFCANTNAGAAAPPPPRPSYGDPRTDLRAAVPAIEAWNIDHGKYAGMTIDQLRAQYDYGIPSGIRVVSATKNAYCIETTVRGHTWSYAGSRQGFRHGGCS
jgi:hypothetical protein